MSRLIGTGLDITSELVLEPSPCISPVTLGSCGRDFQDFGSFRCGQTGKIAKFDELGFSAISFGQPDQSFVQGDQFVGGLLARQLPQINSSR